MAQVTFFVRSNNDKAQTHVLYCRVTINGKQAEFSTTEKVETNNWNQLTQQYKCESAEKTNYINLLTQSLGYKIKTAAVALDKETELEPKELIEFITKKNNEPTPRFTEIVTKFYKYEVGQKELELTTLVKHKVYIKNLVAFENGKNFSVSDFTLVQAEKFKDWFADMKETTKKSTASRNILYYKNAMQWGITKGIIKHHELLYFKGTKDKVKKVVSLTEAELEKLILKQFSSSLLQKVKDLYLFQISTGLSYCDIYGDLKIIDTEGGKIIEGMRKKTKKYGQKFFIPYDETAETLLSKYNGSLPKLENGVYNRILKEIAAILELDKHLTTHTGRKTFATLKNERGWTRESVALMLGHKSVKTTETYYIGVSANRLVNEMVQRG